MAWYRVSILEGDKKANVVEIRDFAGDPRRNCAPSSTPGAAMHRPPVPFLHVHLLLAVIAFAVLALLGPCLVRAALQQPPADWRWGLAAVLGALAWPPAEPASKPAPARRRDGCGQNPVQLPAGAA
jgi:hypothetical protein